MNLYRSSPPDFDLDFSWRDREAVGRCLLFVAAGGMFGGGGEHHDAHEEPQEGRISILATDQALTPDPTLASRTNARIVRCILLYSKWVTSDSDDGVGRNAPSADFGGKPMPANPSMPAVRRFSLPTACIALRS